MSNIIIKISKIIYLYQTNISEIQFFAKIKISNKRMTLAFSMALFSMKNLQKRF